MRCKVKFNCSSVVLTILLVVFLIDCSCNNKTDKKTTESNVIEAGKISNPISCRSNNQYSYHYYLPKNFNPGKQYPLIILFDAHARSKMAISRFTEASDKYEYMLIASDQARNGIQDINPIINAIWDDAIDRLPVDISRVYTAGFSGGARIAASVAIYKGGIKGVIGCGGGMPSPGQELKTRFEFLSIVGKDDLNYQELKTLDKELKDNGFVCQFFSFDGGHDWPPSQLITKGVEWLELMSIKQKRIPVNDALVREYSVQYADSINAHIRSGQSYEAFLLYSILLTDLEGIYDITDYKKSFEALQKDTQVENGKLETEKIKKEELSEQEQLLDAFKNASFSVLKEKAGKYQSGLKTLKGEQLHKTKRLVAYMGMLSFLYVESSLNAQNKSKYSGYMEVYEMLEPGNPDILFFKACQSIMDNQPDKALDFLQKSLDLGFYDFFRLQNIGYFEELRTRPEFDMLVSRARKKFDQLQ